MTDEEKLRKFSEPFLMVTSRFPKDTYNPMDLRTLQKRLDGAYYDTAEEFAEDFRLMISETYRGCIEKDPLLEQASELRHEFEIAFAKSVQLTEEPEVGKKRKLEYNMVPDDDDEGEQETKRLKDILEIGRAMQREIDRMVEKESRIEEKKKVDSARLLVKEIESVGPEVMEEIIRIIQENKEPLDIQSDGTVAVSYDTLSSSTISQLRRAIRSFNS